MKNIFLYFVTSFIFVIAGFSQAGIPNGYELKYKTDFKDTE